MQALQTIELLAGYDPNNQPIVERLSVRVLPDDSCQLAKSPAFLQGIASGDVIKLDKDSKSFEIVQRSGNLAIRVYARANMEALADALGSELEKLGGELDIETPRMLVFSIHVSCGFEQIEALLNRFIDGETSAWRYGNVYDPNDGKTPLNWWVEILKQV